MQATLTLTHSQAHRHVQRHARMATRTPSHQGAANVSMPGSWRWIMRAVDRAGGEGINDSSKVAQASSKHVASRPQALTLTRRQTLNDTQIQCQSVGAQKYATFWSEQTEGDRQRDWDRKRHSDTNGWTELLDSSNGDDDNDDGSSQTRSHTHAHRHEQIQRTQLNVESLICSHRERTKEMVDMVKRCWKYMSKPSKKFLSLWFFFSYPTCAGNGNRIIKAKLKTFTHHTKNEWQQESRKEGREEDKPDTHTRQIRKLFAKGLRRAYPTLHLTLSALPGPTLPCPACLCEWGKLFAKFVGAQIYEQTTTKLRVVVGRGGECQGRDCNPGGAGGVVESKMKCDLWSYKSKFGAWVDC